MPEVTEPNAGSAMIKIVYFDEQTASDYLDIASGGKAASTSQSIRKRASETSARAQAKVRAKLSWLPFVGVDAQLGAGAALSRASQSFLSKTLSNTILTDYLDHAGNDPRVKLLKELKVSAAEGSMASIKMYTPFMVIAETKSMGIDLARLDEALERAKGYYELLAIHTVTRAQCILRFNISAFRNNYGLSDLGKMELTYHAVRVGQAREADLALENEVQVGAPPTTPVDGLALLDGKDPVEEPLLDVYDVVLAGVQ